MRLDILQKKILILSALIVIFITGWLTNSLFGGNQELPYINNNLPSIGDSSERLSPQDYISEDQIIVQKDQVIIKVKNPSWARYTNTNSMDPILDNGANGIEIIPNCEDIKAGDIIAYESKFVSGLIVHRVIEINKDENGIYFTLKGDNAPFKDAEKVRCDQIKYQLIAIIY